LLTYFSRLCFFLAFALASPSSDLTSIHNNYRARNGMRRLRCSRDLRREAQECAVIMASKHKLFHDTTPTGGLRTGWSAWGENVGYGSGGSQAEEQIFSAFLNSPPHKANIRGRWTHIGIGYATAPDGTAWWTVKFANYGQKTIPGC
jgi:uncharacterized protein YkwD